MSHSEGGVRGGPNHKELREASERTRKAYAVWLNPPEYQLYDLSNDPWEFSNLGGQQAYAAVEKRLKQALREWMKEANDWLPNKEKVKRLAAENDAVPYPKRKYPEGGWKYNEYLHK
jgi:N-sulfoglucosamine sulfohydrolase